MTDGDTAGEVRSVCTFRDNYSAAGEAIDYPLIENPDLVKTPTIGSLCVRVDLAVERVQSRCRRGRLRRSLRHHQSRQPTQASAQSRGSRSMARNSARRLSMNGSVFRSAIRGNDGEVDAGYLALFWIMAVVITAIPFMCIFAMVAMWLDPEHKFDVQGLGIGIGSVCTGFGVAVGAVGAFRMGDKDRPPALGSVTTTTSKVETKPAAATGDPLAVVVQNVEPVPVMETPPPKKKRPTK